MRAGFSRVLSAPDPPALLRLDEATNHTGIDAVSALQTGPRGASGALVVVSYDWAFSTAIGVRQVLVPGW